MYEIYTQEARKVMASANQEAMRFNQQYIGTEHILLGLLKEASGIAAAVLKNLDIDLRKVRLELEQVIQSGPQLLATGKLPATPRAKKVIEYAREEARGLTHNYVGTEHLLLGLMREQESIAAQVLWNNGLRIDTVRDEIVNLLGAGMRRRPTSSRPAVEIQDLPGELQQAAAELDAEIKRLILEKEAAAAEQEFDKAAGLRDREYEVRRRKAALVREWIVNRALEAAWLSANDAAVKKLAQRINEERRWQDLPLLADALEAAGCMDRELIDHCRQPGEHSRQCWVIDVILAH